MEITVTGRHIEVTQAMREHAAEKAAKLPKYYDRITHVEVVIDPGPHNHELDVELRVHVERHDPFIAKVSHEDPYAGLDLAISKMERQLSDHKDKLRNRKHQA